MFFWEIFGGKSYAADGYSVFRRRVLFEIEIPCILLFLIRNKNSQNSPKRTHPKYRPAPFTSGFCGSATTNYENGWFSKGTRASRREKTFFSKLKKLNESSNADATESQGQKKLPSFSHVWSIEYRTYVGVFSLSANSCTSMPREIQAFNKEDKTVASKHSFIFC